MLIIVMVTGNLPGAASAAHLYGRASSEQGLSKEDPEINSSESKQTVDTEPENEIKLTEQAVETESEELSKITDQPVSTETEELSKTTEQPVIVETEEQHKTTEQPFETESQGQLKQSEEQRESDAQEQTKSTDFAEDQSEAKTKKPIGPDKIYSEDQLTIEELGTFSVVNTSTQYQITYVPQRAGQEENLKIVFPPFYIMGNKPTDTPSYSITEKKLDYIGDVAAFQGKTYQEYSINIKANVTDQINLTFNMDAKVNGYYGGFLDSMTSAMVKAGGDAGNIPLDISVIATDADGSEMMRKTVKQTSTLSNPAELISTGIGYDARYDGLASISPEAKFYSKNGYTEDLAIQEKINYPVSNICMFVPFPEDAQGNVLEGAVLDCNIRYFRGTGNDDTKIEEIEVEGKKYWKISKKSNGTYPQNGYLGTFTSKNKLEFGRLNIKLQSYDQILKLKDNKIVFGNCFIEYNYLGKSKKMDILKLGEYKIQTFDAETTISPYTEPLAQGDNGNIRGTIYNGYEASKSEWKELPRNYGECDASYTLPNGVAIESIKYSFVYNGGTTGTELKSVTYYEEGKLDEAGTEISVSGGAINFPSEVKIGKIVFHYTKFVPGSNMNVVLNIRTDEFDEDKQVNVVGEFDSQDVHTMTKFPLELVKKQDVLTVAGAKYVKDIFCNNNGTEELLIADFQRNNTSVVMQDYEGIVINIAEAGQAADVISNITSITTGMKVGDKDSGASVSGIDVHYSTNKRQEVVESFAANEKVHKLKLDEDEYITEISIYMGKIIGKNTNIYNNRISILLNKSRTFMGKDGTAIKEGEKRNILSKVTIPSQNKENIQLTDVTYRYILYKEEKMQLSKDEAEVDKEKSVYQGAEIKNLTLGCYYKLPNNRNDSLTTYTIAPKLYLEVSKDCSISVKTINSKKCSIIEEKYLENGNKLLIFQSPPEVYLGNETSYLDRRIKYSISAFFSRDAEIGIRPYIFNAGLSFDGEFDKNFYTKEYADTNGYYMTKFTGEKFPEAWGIGEEVKEQSFWKTFDAATGYITVNRLTVGGLSITPGVVGQYNTEAIFFAHEKEKLIAQMSVNNLNDSPVYNYKSTFTLPNKGESIKGSNPDEGGEMEYNAEFSLYLNGIVKMNDNEKAEIHYYDSDGNLVELSEDSSPEELQKVRAFTIEVDEVVMNRPVSANVPIRTDSVKTGANVEDMVSYIGGKSQHAISPGGRPSAETYVVPAKYVYSSYVLKGSTRLDPNEDGIGTINDKLYDVVIKAKSEDGVVSTATSKNGKYELKVNQDAVSVSVICPDQMKLTKNITGIADNNDFDRETRSCSINMEELQEDNTSGNYDAVFVNLPKVTRKDISLNVGEETELDFTKNVTGTTDVATLNKYKIILTGPEPSGRATFGQINDKKVMVNGIRGGDSSYTVKAVNTLGDESPLATGTIKVISPTKELSLNSDITGPSIEKMEGILPGNYKVSVESTSSGLVLERPETVEANRLLWGSKKANTTFGLQVGGAAVSKGLDSTVITVGEDGILPIILTNANALSGKSTYTVQLKLFDEETEDIICNMKLTMNISATQLSVTVPLSISVCVAKDGSMVQPDSSKMFIENRSRCPIDVSVSTGVEKNKMMDRENGESAGMPPDIGYNGKTLTINSDDAQSIQLSTYRWVGEYQLFGDATGVLGEKIHFNFTSKGFGSNPGKDLYYTIVFKAVMKGG